MAMEATPAQYSVVYAPTYVRMYAYICTWYGIYVRMHAYIRTYSSSSSSSRARVWACAVCVCRVFCFMCLFVVCLLAYFIACAERALARIGYTSMGLAMHVSRLSKPYLVFVARVLWEGFGSRWLYT